MPKLVHRLTEAMMTLIKMNGPLGIKGRSILFCLVGLLACELSSQDVVEVEDPMDALSSLTLKLKLLTNRHRLLCDRHAELAANCSASAVPECTECPDGWIHVGDKCFLLETDRHNWQDSSEKCKERDATLAKLTTKEEHEALEDEARRIGGTYYYWIGLNDIETEGEWKWVDNSELKISFWNTLKWELYNHESGGELGEDCAVVDSFNRNWFDVPCTFSYPRVCQRPARPMAPQAQGAPS